VTDHSERKLIDIGGDGFEELRHTGPALVSINRTPPQESRPWLELEERVLDAG
jgi:hypothetical protein